MVDRPSQWLTLTTIVISHNMNDLTIPIIIKPEVCLITSYIAFPRIFLLLTKNTLTG
jgi:hypothetical protein